MSHPSTTRVFFNLGFPGGLVPLSDEVRKNALLLHLSRRLQNLENPQGEPLEVGPVQEGLTHVHRRELWPEASLAPFQFGSDSGLPVISSSNVVVGCTDALMRTVVHDMGQLCTTREAANPLDNMCQINSLASAVSAQPGIVPNDPERMANGPWCLVHGLCSIVHGPLSMVDDRWSMVHGHSQWSTVYIWTPET